ncbi:hypothetical protein JCM31598_30510 [Desulfonatronum parangueonense]
MVRLVRVVVSRHCALILIFALPGNRDRDRLRHENAPSDGFASDTIPNSDPDSDAKPGNSIVC